MGPSVSMDMSSFGKWDRCRKYVVPDLVQLSVVKRIIVSSILLFIIMGIN